MPELLWEGRPSAASFLGAYLLYSMPLWTQLIVLLASGFLTLRGFPFDQLYSAANALTGLSGVYGAVYLSGLLLAILFSVVDWLVRVDAAPLLFTAASYSTVEGLRLAGILPPVFPARVALLSLSSALGVLAVEVYRRSFRYSVTSESIIIRGGLLRGWERVVRRAFMSDVVTLRPLLGYLLGYAHIVPVTQSQLGTGSTFSVGAVVTGKRGLEVLVGGGRELRGVEARPWNCIYGVRDFEKVKEAVLK